MSSQGDAHRARTSRGAVGGAGGVTFVSLLAFALFDREDGDTLQVAPLKQGFPCNGIGSANRLVSRLLGS